MSRLSWNKAPYFDDFRSSKNFMKILIQPGRAVQTRELNQIQSILQNQIEKFANHIFKNGSRVSNARANYVAKAYVRLQSKSTWITDVSHPDGYDVTDLTVYSPGTRLVGQTSGITAILVKSVNAENSDPPTIYVVYTGTAIDGVTTTFIPGEIIRIYDLNGIPVYSVTVKCPGCSGSNDLDPILPTGLGKIFTIDEGVFYYEGMFIENSKQDIIISKYGEENNYKVGFDFVQRIIKSDDDSTLLDNTLGYPNQSAPGADRYKVDLLLTKRTLNSSDGENFLLLAKFEKGTYTYFKADSEYSDIMDMIAKRTYETNGNYTVSSFKLRFIEDRAESVNDPNGYSVDGDEDYVRAVVGPGISYVKGYRYESTGERFLKEFKARDVQQTAGFTHTFEDRTHIFLQPIISYSAYPNDPSVVSNTDDTIVDVYDGPFSAGKLPTGSVIGSFKVFDVKQDPTKGVINSKGVLQSITVVNGGSAYTSAPTVQITGGAGSGANAVATIANGKVISVTVTTGGADYEFAPTITFTGGGGSGASAKAVIYGPAVFKYYIYDVEMIGTNKLNQGKSFVDRSQVHGFKAVPYSDDVTIYNPNNSELIWKLSRDNIKTLRSIADEGNPDPPGTMAIMLRRKMTATISGGQVTFTSNTSEFFQDFDPSSTVAVITDNDAGAGIIHTVDLSVPGRFSRTPTSITITLGSTLDVGLVDPITTSGNSLTIIHNTLRTNGQEDTKEIAETQEVVLVPTGLEFPVRVSTSGNPISDFIELLYVYQYDPANLLLTHTDVTEYFTVENGISENGYREAKMKVSPTFSINPALRWRYKAKYYNHNHSKNLGFFTVDSYRDLIADGDINYEDNPTLVAKNKKEYPLFGCLDFRPTIINGSTVAGSVIPVIGSTAIFDISYYLGRIDLLCVNKDGELYIKGGSPSDSPKPPKIDDDSMALYEIHLDPYTYTTNDIKVKYIENKRYTMRDIGRIEERLKIVEYYTALNLLEKSAADMSIKDANGLDRFKNGFIADNFQDYQAADCASSDFRAALDRKSRELRPSFTPRNKKLGYLPAESDAFELGQIAMIEYDSVVVDEQPYATKHISINPHFQFKKMGTMFLTPNNDVWSDVTRQPDLVVNVDTGVDALRDIANAAGVLGTEWGSWRELNRTVNSDSSVTSVQGGGTTTNTTTTTTSDQTRTGVTRSIESRTDSYDLGDRVTDVSIQPYMRNVAINFFATKMKANTKVWAYFDKKPVSDSTRMIGGANGMQLVTDPNGQIGGTFDCPGGIFFTGDRKFYLTADEKLTGDPDVETTAAEAVFFSGGLNVTKQKTTMNVTTPVVTEETVTENRTTSSTSTSSKTDCPTGTFWNGTSCAAQPPRCSECQNCAGCTDPISQSFKLPRDHFVTGFDVYFAEIDPNPEELFFQLRTMVNGYPGSTILGEKKHQTSELVTSADSSIPFHVEFDFPIYCAGKTEYCFVIGGFSPDTRAWVAKLGQEIIDQPGKIIETQPSGGSSFRSQNASTWNAEQLEDIKYKIYAAKFKKREMTVAFEHLSERLHLDRDPFESEATKTKIRVTMLDHGFVVNDKVTISMLEDEWIEINIPAGQGQMNIGMVVTTSGGFHGIVYDYRTNQVKTEIRMKNISGTFALNETFNCAAIDVPVHDNYLISKLGFTNSMLSTTGSIRYNTVSGTFKSLYSQSINGIPISELSKQHIIQTVDSMDSFIIQVTTPATASGRFGGEEVYANANEKYEVFNVTGAYLPYGSSEVFTYRGIGHNPLNGPFASEDYSQMKEKEIVLSQDNHLGQPHKIVSDENAGAGGKRVRVVGTFVAPDEFLSPVVNTDTFSVTTVSNRVEWVTSAQLNIEPNATGRYRSERDPMNGSGNYKYVTRTIVLKNPASDLIIAFDVYKDLYADFDIWLKVVAPYEEVDIDTKQWMRVVGYDKSHNSVDLLDRIELELTMSELQLETDDVGTLIDWEDLPNDEFSQFKIKIVCQAKNPAKPPLFQSFRGIAVT